MTDQVKDFVATYKPKPTPEPFFGFFENIQPEYPVRMPKYQKVRLLVNKGHSDEFIMDQLNITNHQLYYAKYYFKHYVRPRSFKST